MNDMVPRIAVDSGNVQVFAQRRPAATHDESGSVLAVVGGTTASGTTVKLAQTPPWARQARCAPSAEHRKLVLDRALHCQRKAWGVRDKNRG